MWTIIALCHDLGYPLEKIGGLNAPLRTMLAAVGKVQVCDFTWDLPRQHEFIDDFIVKFISSNLLKAGKDPETGDPQFRTAIQPKYYLKFSKSFEDLQHGILSTTLLMKRLVYFLESDFDISEAKTLDTDDARQYLIRREILRAIATHSCEEIYHIRCDTFGFLLLLCDELQEWDRPTFYELRGRPAVDTWPSIFRYGNHSVSVGMDFIARENVRVREFAGQMDDKVNRLFRKLHKVLRSAADVRKRDEYLKEFKWTVSLTHPGKSPVELVFRHAGQNVSQVTINGNPADEWLYGNDGRLQEAFGLDTGDTSSS